ncbi:hypothetical protein PGT21_015251 [Puccinia graminis f. sp. tritici]|uniref:Uncharacterized protein n=1 Tax=Puccinia graminis f. sp. tritici TaxID=56615 RepID=A0A5B0LN01_PUCGR|nr:hypothetical protein PGT21_015251 [Puccinia graminis f. sp. tritici]KAA1130551.1 hypothetical protein PGTUg99_020796 [Puccinia graminis f. sp. tritici]
MPVKLHHPPNKTTTTTTNNTNSNSNSTTNSNTNKRQTNPNVSASQRNSTSQTTLVLNRSKVNLHKKRPTGLSRNNTSINLSKPTALSQQKKTQKPSKKGAFKGALDADPDDDDETNDHQPALDHQQHSSLTQTHTHTHTQNQNEEEVWVSEPSTRCTTPQPVTHTSDHHQTITDLQLELQLPNPLSPSKFLPLVPSSIPLPPPQQHPHNPIPSTSQPNPSSPPRPSSSQKQDHQPAPHPPSTPRPEQETRGRSKSRHRSHNPIERSTRSELSPPNLQLTIPTIQNSPEPLHQQPTSSSPTRPESPLRYSYKGKAKASPGSSHKPTSAKRSSINSVRSLSSLVIFHNDALLKSQSSRLALKRVDSTASVVLPPKVDTTEAVIALNGKASFNPTLMSISDFPTEATSGRSESTPNTAVCSPVATSSKTPFPSRRPLPDSPHHYSSQPDQRSKPGQPGSPSLNPSGAGLDQSECARRLKKYSHVSRPSQLINMQAANESSSGLISSLLSPGLTFKSRRSEPSTHGNGYFDSFKSLVGISSLVDQVAEEAGASSKAASPELARRGSSTAEAEEHTPAGQPLVGTSSSNSLAKRDPKTGISLNGVRYPFAQSQKLLGHPRPTQPKPAVPGFITTCGSQPVVSKFLGPRPSTTTTTTMMTDSQPVASTSTQPAPGSSTQWSMTDSPPDYVRYPPDSPSHSSSSRRTGPENTGSMTRIQKKLLMERDRPISPTLFDSPSPPTPAGPSAPPPLPPPSYLIRSLGGQTGPLPFIPFNLLPSEPAHLPASVLHDHSHPPPFPPPPHPSALSPPPPPSSSSFPSTHHHPSLDPLHHHHHQLEQLEHQVDHPHHHHPQLQQDQQLQQLNQPALKAKQALSIKLWRNSLIDEVEQVLTDHESNTRFRNPLFASLARVSNFYSSN